ncbi:hypothetical protein WH96_05085 [Kiloniella spongiae]|uniref:histidine kinase n=2 Tax=Kiloniella spongiae TaxID=1489064 RepID=A0A0H2MIG6_9PROT|nr:hypothetical protein WH96_05085 [Kiloniella spongiae]
MTDFAPSNPFHFYFGTLQAKDALLQDLGEMTKTLENATMEAQKANMAKTSFLATMSHELRTPLNTIIGFSELITNQINGPIGNSDYISYANDINSAGHNLLSVVNDVLNAAKLESGKIELKETEFELISLLNSCAKKINTSAAEKSITIDLEFAQGISQIYADPDQVKRIINNLLSNAVKFTPNKGTVVINCYLSPEKQLIIEVSDNGIGIESKNLKEIFEPFKQVQKVLTRDYEGSGLGLYITKSLVVLHGGEIAIDSHVDKGTKITTTFPSYRVI